MSGEKVSIEPFFSVLKSLDQSGSVYFLEGGQAVNLWTSYIYDEFGKDSGLEPYLPFTSKDRDVFVGKDALRFFENAAGTLYKSQSPAEGQPGIYVLPEDDSLHVDLMTSVYGIPMSQIPRDQACPAGRGSLRPLPHLSLQSKVPQSRQTPSSRKTRWQARRHDDLHPARLFLSSCRRTFRRQPHRAPSHQGTQIPRRNLHQRSSRQTDPPTARDPPRKAHPSRPPHFRFTPGP